MKEIVSFPDKDTQWFMKNMPNIISIYKKHRETEIHFGRSVGEIQSLKVESETAKFPSKAEIFERHSAPPSIASLRKIITFANRL